jgi:hypothetical protein
VAELIPDLDDISRLLFEPVMRLDKDLIWENVFQFPTSGGQTESLVWRKYAATIAEVHALGCGHQAAARQKGKSAAYFGGISGNVGDIRSLKSANGISFTIDHFPDEGQEHAHIGFTAGSQKNDRNSLKVLLRSKFGSVESHTCPADPASQP